MDHRKILTNKLNSSSTVHTDNLIGLKTKVPATHDNLKSKQSIIIHESVASAGNMESSTTLRSGSVIQEGYASNKAPVATFKQFRSPQVTITRHVSPKSQFRDQSLFKREIIEASQEHSPSAGCLKRKDLSNFVMHKVIKSPKEMINRAREKISRSV